MIPNLVRLAHDEWQENKHPRKDNGQFGQGGVSGAPAAGSGPAQVSSTITGIMKAGGYKKQSTPGPNGTAVYYHPSGAKIHVHPAPAGKKWSSQWTSSKPGSEDKKGEGSSLAKLLRVAVEKAEAKKAAAAPAMSEATQAEVKKSEAWLKSIGYAPDHTEGASVTYVKHQNNAAVEYNAETKAWVAQTPGHATKEGTGLHTLDALFNGKVEDGVKNSSKIPKTAAIAKAATATAANKQAVVGHVKAYNDLKKAAPVATPEEHSAISYYGGSGYTQLNNSLRHNPSYAVTDKTVKHLDEYLKKSSIPEDITVYRGIRGEFAKIIKSVVMEGTKLIDRGFISTSTISDTADNFGHGGLMMKISLKKGQMGAAIGHMSGHSGEYEVLLPRNSALVVKAYNPGAGTIEVELEQSHL